MALVVLAQLIDLYMLIVLGAVIISWLKLPPTNTVTIVLHRLTEPVLGPIRRVLPQGIVKLRLTAVFDAQHGGLATS